MILIILATVLFALIYYGLHKPHRYWSRRGVPQEPPVPLFGSLFHVIFQRVSMPDFFIQIYNKYERQRYVAFYQFLTPTLMLRDPDLIKQIAIKEFDTFPEHTNFVSRESDPLWAKNLFALPGGQEWKDIRHTLSPAFTSNKLKGMFGLITTCAQQFVDYFKRNQDELIVIEMKDTFTKVTNDIIATTAFGITCNSLTNPENEIFQKGKGVAEGDAITNLKFFVAAINPKLSKYLKIRFIGEEFTRFFRCLIKKTITVREEKEIVRPDMIHLLMEARRGKLKHDDSGELSPDSSFVYGHQGSEKDNRAVLTDDVITSQALVFYMAGFDTVSRAMCFTSYELALNIEIQQRLRAEVDEVLEACAGTVTYEALMGMKYMEMVVSESLRKWPPFAVTDRKPIKSFTIERRHSDEPRFTLDTDTVVQIPIFAIHRDPKFYPEPLRFDPERFVDDNKHHHMKYGYYLPFGLGPRNCIGSRFAVLELKTIIFYTLANFEITVTDKTAIPLTLSKKNVSPDSENGFWLGLKRRK